MGLAERRRIAEIKEKHQPRFQADTRQVSRKTRDPSVSITVRGGEIQLRIRACKEWPYGPSVLISVPQDDETSLGATNPGAAETIGTTLSRSSLSAASRSLMVTSTTTACISVLLASR